MWDGAPYDVLSAALKLRNVAGRKFFQKKQKLV